MTPTTTPPASLPVTPPTEAEQKLEQEIFVCSQFFPNWLARFYPLIRAHVAAEVASATAELERKLTYTETAIYMADLQAAQEKAKKLEAENAGLLAQVDTMRHALEVARMELWEYTTEVSFDSTVVFSHGYDFFGLENCRREMRCEGRGYMVWPEGTSGTAKKWSAYGGNDGYMWLAKFDSQDAAMRCVEEHIAARDPKHPAAVIRKALAHTTASAGAELAALREDKARLDWLENGERGVDTFFKDSPNGDAVWKMWQIQGLGLETARYSIREVIDDAARGAAKEDAAP